MKKTTRKRLTKILHIYSKMIWNSEDGSEQERILQEKASKFRAILKADNERRERERKSERFLSMYN